MSVLVYKTRWTWAGHRKLVELLGGDDVVMMRGAQREATTMTNLAAKRGIEVMTPEVVEQLLSEIKCR